MSLHKKINTGRFTSERVKTHGMSQTKLYKMWHSMVARATGKSSKSTSKHYFDRGITVCERWLKFENFFQDMGNPPEGFTLDRIDNNGDYEPSNCRWADRVTQANNKSDNVLITVKGETKTIAEWARSSGLNPNTLVYRIRRGWDLEKAVENIKHKQDKTIKKESRERGCLICGGLFIPRIAQLKAGQGKCCSQKCSAVLKKRTVNGTRFNGEAIN